MSNNENGTEIAPTASALQEWISLIRTGQKIQMQIHNRLGELVALKMLELTDRHTTQEIEAAVYGGERHGEITNPEA